MRHIFDNNSSYFPFRWLIVYAAILMLCMAYTDAAGVRAFYFSGGGARGAYYGGPTGHK